MKSILLVKKFLGLVEMMSGLVNASFSLPEWQAVKMIFFAPCLELGNFKITWEEHAPRNPRKRGLMAPCCYCQLL